MKIADLAPEYAAALTEGKRDDIANLQPDTVLSLFHGSDAGTAATLVRNGIDGRQRVHRHYPHTVKIDDGKPVLINRGLFVGPDLKDAAKFGHAVVKFKAQARNLHHIWPVADKVRQDDAFWRGFFPNSFRPSVSAYLSGRAWQSEPQALFRGLVSPRAIERVYLSAQLYGGDFPDHPRVTAEGPEMIPLDPQAYLDWFDKDKKGRPRRVAVEPQERVTAEEYLERLCREYGCSIDTLVDVLTDFLSKADSYEKQIHVVMAPGGGGAGWRDHPDVPYSAAKRVLPRLLSHLGIGAASNPRWEPERYYGF